MIKKMLSEFFGTFALVLVGTGSIIINEEYNGILGVTGIAITVGLAVTMIILLLGKFSGSHINPAVSVSLAIVGWFQRKKIIPYIFSQVAGGLTATLLLHALFPQNINLGNTIPSGSYFVSFVLEVALTFILMAVILFSEKYFHHSKYIPAFAIGFTVFLAANYAGPICGASMNPARTIAPALVSGNLNSLWIYIIGPLLGATSMAWLWKNKIMS